MHKSTVFSTALALVSGVAGYFTGSTGDSPPPRKVLPHQTSKVHPSVPVPAAPLPPWPAFEPSIPRRFFQALARDPRLIASRNITEYPANAENDPQFYELVCRWIIRDPKEAGNWIARQPESWQRHFGDSAPADSLFPDSSFEVLKRVPSLGVTAFASQFVSQLPYDPATLQAVLHSDPPVLPPRALTALWEAWSRWDGPAAMEAARHAGLSNAAYREVLGAAAIRWPEETLKEAAKLKGDEFVYASDFVLTMLADLWPETALQHLREHPDTTRMEDHAMAALQSLLNSGSTLSTDTATLFPDKWQPYVRVRLALSRNDPAAAAAEWSTEMVRPQTGHKTPILREIAQQFALFDPAAALSWAVSVPDAADRCRATSAVALAGTASNPEAVSIWLNTCPPSRDADRVISILLDQLEDDPEAAFAWAGRLSSPGQSAAVRQRILSKNPLYTPSVDGFLTLPETIPAPGADTEIQNNP